MKSRLAPAKVNLFLHVGDKRAGGGYHDLLSLVVFANVGDRLSLAPSDRLSLIVRGAFPDIGPSGDNLVVKAVSALQAWADKHGHKTKAVELTLEKNLPIASGMGGGSSDAAATLLMLSAYWGLPIAVDELEALGLQLGADVPVCLRVAATLVSGVGEVLEPVDNLPPFALVLANPRVEVPTAQVFKALTVRSGAIAPPRPAFASARDLAMYLDRTMNDLAAPAKAIAPIIMHVENALAATDGCLTARMSGSGATCFGLYETAAAAEAAARAIAIAHPGWWVKAAASYAAA
ncbi:MAG: 4-(cytidine 5'-diphospho)-2-C-methyl-D-erythritol kinase [Alphaproteobacteria bacterium]|nr:4-(cytidine 5'-diphospho)-2-C-methyl-D-erythritol kinase [Alphaproteobacteria bacterium]